MEKVHYFECISKTVKMSKIVDLASFWKTEACGQTVLPDWLIQKGPLNEKNAKIAKKYAKNGQFGEFLKTLAVK